MGQLSFQRLITSYEGRLSDLLSYWYARIWQIVLAVVRAFSRITSSLLASQNERSAATRNDPATRKYRRGITHFRISIMAVHEEAKWKYRPSTRRRKITL